MTKKVRYGILSTAQIARNQHIPAIRESVNAEVIAISSRSQTTAEGYAAELGIGSAYGSYDAMLADSRVDAVINALPNSMHCEWTVKAAEAGKHILCEKPLAVTVDQAQIMLDAARANGVLLLEGFTPRYEQQMVFAQKLLRDGVIGEVKIIRSELTYTIQDWNNDSRVKSELAGGSLMDAGCYCVNAIRFLIEQEPQSVVGYQRTHATAGVDSTFVGLMQFKDGCVGYVATGMEQPFRACCEIIGSTGRIEIPGMFGGAKVKVQSGSTEETHGFETSNRFCLQIEHFSNCILNDLPLKFPPEDGLANTRVLVALKQAALTGCQIPVV
ncbi:MAG: Gfo/Idh/MocA family oxidoreductase [Anaerolineae bacterium]|nr:Gfo/Idh/MocA family oxidoreductase [Anaerolineae bacterium]